MNVTHISSTMTLMNARTTDTGEYECKLQQFPELFVRQYIYVNGILRICFVHDHIILSKTSSNSNFSLFFLHSQKRFGVFQ
jgi:hypothetical protein